MKKIGMLVAVVGSLNAGTIVHTITVNPTLTDWSVTNRVPQFDQRLGTLKSVQVTISANAAGRSEYVSLDRGWRLPVALAVTNVVSARVGGLTASDSGSSANRFVVSYGFTNVGGFAMSLGRAVSTNLNLSTFIGTNTLPVVTTATARTWYAGPGDFTLRWDTRASAVATVAYVFASDCDKDKDDDGDKDSDKDGGGR